MSPALVVPAKNLKNAMADEISLPVSPLRCRDYILCILSAGLLTLSFPAFNLEFLAWFGFVPLFFALKNKTKGKAFLLSYFAGVIFWFGTIYWLIHVTPVGMVLLALYLALYFGLFGLFITTINYKPSTINVLIIPSIWVALEYLRSHLLTGFPWALLGYSQYLNLPVIQIADITGVWGVSFLIMMVNIAIYKVVGYRLWVIGRKQEGTLPATCYLLPAILLIFSIGYGLFKLYLQPTIHNLQPIRISVIQGNIPQELKWDVRARDFIINRYLGLTAQAERENPGLIIWPEASLPCILEEEPWHYERVLRFAKEGNINLILGAVTREGDSYYNSALLVSSRGNTKSRYNKLHLVPFGEYIPLRNIFSLLETIAPIGDITRGKEYTIFNLGADHRTRFSVLICFEDLFPELSRNFVKKGADFLINITNDAWYQKTSAAEQHLQASVFRAIENRVFLVRSANTGISGFIAPTGALIFLVEDNSGNNIFVEGHKTQDIAITKRPTAFYTHYGDIFIFLLCILIVYSKIR